MYRVVKLPFYANKNVIDKLFELNRLSAEVWNDSVQIAKDYFLSSGKWINKTELQKQTKGKYTMHSQSIQNVVHKYLEARDAAKVAKTKGYHNKYPYKTKKYFNTVWVDKGFELSQNGNLELSLGNGIKGAKRPPKLKCKLSKNRILECFDAAGNCLVTEIELIYDKKLMFCLTIDDGIVVKTSSGSGTAAIDQGEIHAIAAQAENGEAIIITGRKIRSIHRLRNKKIGELQKLMSKCTKGSRQHKKYAKAMRFVRSKSEAQLADALHKATKQFVDWAVDQSVNRVVVGDVEGVQRHTSARKKHNKKRRHRLTNQKLSNWSFGKLYNYLNYKLKAHGITIQKVDEAYSSQTCPVCVHRRKTSARTYRCKCGYSKHRDIHGACNILTKHLHGAFVPITTTNIKYKRIA